MFWYDGDGTRVASVIDTGAGPVLSDYFAGGSYEVTTNPTGSISATKKYYSLGGVSILDDGSGLQYLLTDQQGSVVGVVDSNGTLTSQRYMPFGQVRGDVNGITKTDFSYTGQRQLSGLDGLLDYRARFYDSSIGRFQQPDLIVSNPANPETWNRYAYVSNSPITRVDPTGHYDCGTEYYTGCMDDPGSKFGSGLQTGETPNEYECRLNKHGKCRDKDTNHGKSNSDSGNVFCDPERGCWTDHVTDVGGTYQDPAVYISLAFGGWASGLYETIGYEGGVACLQSALCRFLVGAAGGAGAEGQGFSSFRRLKQFLGDPGDDMEWHHIVEQIQIQKSGFPVEQIQNTNNIIAVHSETHDLITAVYNSNVFGPGSGRVRDWLAGQSFEAQYEYGIQVLRNLGVIP